MKSNKDNSHDLSGILELERELSRIDSSLPLNFAEEVMAKLETRSMFFDRHFFSGFAASAMTCLLAIFSLGNPFYGGENAPAIPSNFQATLSSEKMTVSAATDVEVLVELVKPRARESSFVFGVLRVSERKGKSPKILLDREDVEQVKQVTELIGS